MTFKEAVQTPLAKCIMFIVIMAVLLTAIYFLSDKIEKDRRAKLKTEKELNLLEKETFEKQQEKIGDSLSVYFMKSWDSLKDTPEFKNCRYEISKSTVILADTAGNASLELMQESTALKLKNCRLSVLSLRPQWSRDIMMK